MADADITQKDPYFIAVKVFLEKDGSFLILKDKFGDWDLPGGRIKKFEFEVPFSVIIQRKMSEELGDDFTYIVAERPEIFMRHERIEASPGNPTVHIFGLGYRAQLTEGEPKLSEAHTELLWVDYTKFKPEDYFTGGWLKGVQEYISSKK